MKIGLFFGTFNPIHHGHLILSNYILNHSSLDEIWLVVSPMSPFKQSSKKLDNFTRKHLVDLAIEPYVGLKSSSIEFNLPKPNYTYRTLAELKDRHPEHEFALIMGQDNYVSLHKWKHVHSLLNLPIYVYPRGGMNGSIEPNPKLDGHKCIVVNAPMVEISSSFIRAELKRGNTVSYMIPSKVAHYIEHNMLYQ